MQQRFCCSVMIILSTWAGVQLAVGTRRPQTSKECCWISMESCTIVVRMGSWLYRDPSKLSSGNDTRWWALYWAIIHRLRGFSSILVGGNSIIMHMHKDYRISSIWTQTATFPHPALPPLRQLGWACQLACCVTQKLEIEFIVAEAMHPRIFNVYPMIYMRMSTVAHLCHI